MGARSRATKSYETEALVLRRTPYREADLVVTLFTAELGQVSALARAARKSQRRFGGSLEPFHTLQTELDEPSGAELMTLRTAQNAKTKRIVDTARRMKARCTRPSNLSGVSKNAGVVISLRSGNESYAWRSRDGALVVDWPS